MAKTGKTATETAANLDIDMKLGNNSTCNQGSNDSKSQLGVMNLPMPRIDANFRPPVVAHARLQDQPSTEPPPCSLTPSTAPNVATFRKPVPSGPLEKSSISSVAEPSSTTKPSYWEGGTHHRKPPKDFSSNQVPVLLDTHPKFTNADIDISQSFLTLKCHDRVPNSILLNWCQTNMAKIQSCVTGTLFAEISKQNFRPIRGVLSSKELLATPAAKIAPLYSQITANLHQSCTLATLRDTQQPKLLSGELSVAKTNEAAHA